MASTCDAFYSVKTKKLLRAIPIPGSDVLEEKAMHWLILIVLGACLYLFTKEYNRAAESNPSPSTQAEHYQNNERQKNRTQLDNVLNMDVYLLAAKHQVDPQILKNALSDFDELTLGFSVERMISQKKTYHPKNDQDEKIVPVSVALKQISQQYVLSEQLLAIILEERRCQKKCEQ